MPNYKYKATSIDGNILTGKREGQSIESIVAWLQESDYIPIDIKEINDRANVLTNNIKLFHAERINNKQTIEFTEQLSTLIKSKLPVDQTLKILQRTSSHEKLKVLIGNILEKVEAGYEFSAALESQKQFDAFYINMIRAAEASGSLESGLNQLYQYLEKAKHMRDKIMSALLYPLILVLVAGISIVMILFFVVPKITELFVGTDQILPIPTQIVITLSDSIVSYWWIIPILIVSIVYYSRIVASNIYHRALWHKLILKIPLICDTIVKAETAKFTKSLGTLISCGVNMQQALPIANSTLNNVVLSQNLDQAIADFKEGKSLYGIFSNVEYFPDLAIQMINVGEETGELDNMLLRISNIYEREVSKTIQRTLSLLEPLLIVALGIIIGGIIISILMAIISVNDLPL